MKKATFSLTVALIFCIVAAPKIVGYKISSSLTQVVNSVNDSSNYQAEIIAFNSGWFTTTATIRVATEKQKSTQAVDVQAEEGSALQVEFTASHGPVRWGENAGVGWAAWIVHIPGESLREYFDWEHDTAFYQMTGSVSLLGKVAYSDTIPAFTAESLLEDMQVDFSGRQGGSELLDSAGYLTVTAPQGKLRASVTAGIIGLDVFSVSLNDLSSLLKYALITADIKADKAAVEYVGKTFFENDYKKYKFPSQMSSDEIKMRARTKMEFVLAVLSMQNLVEVSDTHYSAAIHLENNQLTVHKSVISLPL